MTLSEREVAVMKLSEESRISEVAAVASLMLGSKQLIYQVARWGAIVSIVVMFLALMAGVIVRYVLSTNLGWVAEVPNLFFPWLTMCGIVAAAARNEHIGVEIVIARLPASMKLLVTLAVDGLALVAFSTMAFHGLNVIEIAGGQRLPITHIAMSWAYWSVVIGFAALALVALINIGLLLTGHSESQVSHGEEGL
ncbi:TRAP transporter small permease [Halomonas binhaiensis]|uniref:TRAP transporter small permease protein n=1 Tax=Halomonas binhaiensis TaxID=2562282 RepID=A0A5C1NL94_9GAMM|nr:TRAP transporter small permease [Halomonas binhaiensis]QEM83148.1 TRAP transporter small permease [Halomonas binhaiensis]